MIVSLDHHMIVRGLEILGLAEKDGNVPFLVDLPMNTLQVIFNALLLRDLQVSKCVLIVHCLSSQSSGCSGYQMAAGCYASVCFSPVFGYNTVWGCSILSSD